MSLKARQTLSLRESASPSSSDDSDEETERIIAVPTGFRARKENKSSDNDAMKSIFTIDTQPLEECDIEQDTEISETPVGKSKTPSNGDDSELVDKRLNELLSKAVCGPAFEKNYGETAKMTGRRALKRARQLDAEKTTGKQWFDLPATELTDEARQDLELLQMRNALDRKAHYRRNDRSVLPKYFQVGRVVDAPQDYYSSRMTKKERKKTMVDELLHDMDFQQKNKATYAAIQAREAKKVRGAFQKRGSRQKKDSNSKKGGKGSKRKRGGAM